jgi:hypothetical protein
MRQRWLLLAASLLLPLRTLGAPMSEADVPAPLKPWIPWVLHDHDERHCPSAGADISQRLCVWPAQLDLALSAAGGHFTLTAELFAPGWLPLPGDGAMWPQDVTRSGQPAPVLMRDGRPALFLPPGAHRIDGNFRWSQLPESLYVPPEAGIVTLKVDGVARSAGRDGRNHVWLGRAVATTSAANHLDVKVFRLLEDDIPPRLVTHLDLEVTGDVRDETLGPVLPADFVAMRIDGNLSARLDDQNRLHVQVRPGVWSLDVTARASSSLAKVKALVGNPPWPADEVWSFQARNELRVVEVSGAPAVDPRQTQMPDGWRNFPAYLVSSGMTLALAERSRGNPNPDPDQVQLQRQLWLDFDGGGYTLQDHLQGRLSRSWRLEAAAPIELGRVDVDGEPQLITKQGEGVGVEVRHGQLQLNADSRINASARRLPAGGWNTDLQAVSTVLNLPPGWRLLAAPGADRADTWISRWTLLDLFIVLIAAVAATRLFGFGAGVITLITLVLIWQEPNAPRSAWLALIAATALLRVLPQSYRDGRLHAWLKRLRWVAAAALLLIAIPFAIQQARTALYPQLEVPGYGPTPVVPVALQEQEQRAEVASEMPAAPPMLAASADMAIRAKGVMMKKADLFDRAASNAAQVAQQSIQRLDPNILTQTGPGLPSWQWQRIDVQWNGPVTADEQVRLWLLAPWLTRALKVLSLVLIAMVILRWLELRTPRPSVRSAAWLLPLACLMALQPRAARADDPAPSPPQAILDQLRDRLLAPPDCAPDCAQMPRLQISATAAGALTLRATIEAATELGVPLPVPAVNAGSDVHTWQPASVVVDGRAASLRRADDGTLWIAVAPGRHDVLIAGPLQGYGQLQLPLPLRPHQVSAALDGWLLSGVNERGEPADALQLLRKAAATETPAAPGENTQALPPLLIVTRTLHLGMDWTVETQVQRIGVTHVPIVATVPLLTGERLTDEHIRSRDGAVELSFAPGQAIAGWNSRLPQDRKLALQASSATDRFEVWRFDVSPLWHAEFAGIAPIFHTAGDFRLETYQPWPGEKVEVAISRPAGVPGQVVTLDAATLSMRPGERATDHTLDLDLRASQGGQYRLKLPESTTAQSLQVDGAPQPLRIEGGQLVLPLHPGAQHFTIALRADRGVSTLTHTPAIETGRGVNARLNVQMPPDRWILFVGGPRLGPAVLFWGVLGVLIAIAIALGRVQLTPLRGLQWTLLMIGLSQLPVWAAGVVVVWLMALGARGRLPAETRAQTFNLAQIGLVALTLVALGLLFRAVAAGLLGAPDMQIAGNDSYDHLLNWYQDRFDPALPRAWILSVPMWSYRVLMLLWALWLASALLAWLRWGWTQFSSGGLWRRSPPRTPTPPVKKDEEKTA